MRAYERFLKYVQIHTQAREDMGVTPSTACQWDLAKVLLEELKQIGMADPSLSEYCVVTASLPATPGCEDAPAIGFLAHMDTATAFSGENVHPILHENYDGGDVVLPMEGRVIRTADFPFLKGLAGKTLITADGSTLLGADDKAGVAEIMAMCQRLIDENIPHGKICVAFTPDEEIGEGADHVDVASFGAKYAYTVDGGAAGSIEYECFNAASARVDITGVSVHPGSAKGIMENSLLLAQEVNSLLPPDEVPAKTAGYEGFFELDNMAGSVAHTVMNYLIRDHDRARFEERKALMERVCAQVGEAHPTAKVKLTMWDTYYNMKDMLTDCMHLVENARTATVRAGLKPLEAPVRGGTDGAVLSYKGLPCPNLGTGGYNCHGPMECIAAEDMDTVVEILLDIVGIYSQYKD